MNRKINRLPRKAAFACAGLALMALSGCVTDDALNDDQTHYASHASDNYPLSAMRHAGNKCGHWPQDLTDTSENQRYQNHGCAVQANIAAMIANPNTINQPAPTDMPMGDQAATAVRNVNKAASSSSSGGFASLFGSSSP